MKPLAWYYTKDFKYFPTPRWQNAPQRPDGHFPFPGKTKVRWIITQDGQMNLQRCYEGKPSSDALVAAVQYARKHRTLLMLMEHTRVFGIVAYFITHDKLKPLRRNHVDITLWEKVHPTIPLQGDLIDGHYKRFIEGKV